MKKLTAVLGAVLLCMAALTGYAGCVFAQETKEYFSFAASKEEVFLNDEVRIAISANPPGGNETVAGFRLQVEYDSTKLTLKRVDTSPQIENGTFRYHNNGDTMTGIYVCSGTAAPDLIGECMILVFRVNEDAVFGETSVSAQIDQVVDWSARQLPSVSSITSVFRITPEIAKEALLTKLVPSEGTLEPAFDPYIQEYALQVGAQTEQVLFELEAADGGTARANRKNLGKQGSVTQFVITATSSDKKNKSQYIVNVTRGEREKAGTTDKEGSSGRSKSGGTSGKTAAGDDGNEDLTAGAVFYGERNLYVVGSGMPVYAVYVIAGALGLFAAGILTAVIVLVRKRKK